MTEIKRLKNIVQLIHGFEAEHVSTIPVTARSQGEAVWEGNVELFNLIGHPNAEGCYAWSFIDESNSEKISAVLNVHPVTSAAKAVRADILARAKSASAGRRFVK